MFLKSINPATEKVIKKYKEFSVEKINKIISDSHKAHLTWKETSFEKRSLVLKNCADLLKNKKDTLATLMALEMGKPIRQGIAEIEKCAECLNYFASISEKALEDEIISTEMKKSYVSYQPLGVVFGIMPWNFPFWQVFRVIAPGLMTGNSFLIKHSENVVGCALEIEKILNQAGLSKNVFRALIMSHKKSEVVLKNPLVRAVTLTGSERAGRSVASLAGKYLKKVVLELGGSDPYIICEDANLEEAASVCVDSRMNNSGQVCIAAKRVLVMNQVYDEFKKLICEKINRKITGNPLDENTELGPLAKKDLTLTLEKQINESVKKGAKLLLGGKPMSQKGFYFEPTVLENIKTNSPAYCEELFGPVLSLFKIKSLEEGIKIANSTSYGLGAAIFSGDETKAELIARNNLEAGVACVNTQVKSDWRLPFGGTKNSGFGRELSVFGLKEFVNIKVIQVK